MKEEKSERLVESMGWGGGGIVERKFFCQGRLLLSLVRSSGTHFARAHACTCNCAPFVDAETFAKPDFSVFEICITNGSYTPMKSIQLEVKSSDYAHNMIFDPTNP